jgi:excisionase family DNA binding protein
MGSKFKKSPVRNLSAIVPIDTAAPEPLLLDIKGAARVLSSTTWTVWNLLWAKKIPFIKIGRRFLIDPVDLRAFIARQKSTQIAA